MDEGICLSITPRGGKILSLGLPGRKLKFIDSFLFLPLALQKLPACFGIENLKKGDFPHQMNKESYFDYDGEMPPENYGVLNRCLIKNIHTLTHGTMTESKQGTISILRRN